jgi:hypothetical protein
LRANFKFIRRRVLPCNAAANRGHRQLRVPSAKDVFEYRRGFARLLDLPFGRQEVTINIGSAATLYKRLVTATEGYAGDVSIIHQAVAVKAAIDAMDTAFAEDRDASF